jgi:hypothetical protein
MSESALTGRLRGARPFAVGITRSVVRVLPVYRLSFPSVMVA